MIPDHLIDKAAQAIVASTGSRPLLADMHPEDAAYARADARAALETVAAEIWAQGFESGVGSEQSGGHFPNPYRASETA